MRTRTTNGEAFDRFWRTFPRHVAKQDAMNAWAKLHPSAELVDKMIAALAWQCRQPGWVKDGGAYVPYPATWLRGRRWEDEPFDPVTAPTLSKADDARRFASLSPQDQLRRLGLK